MEKPTDSKEAVVELPNYWGEVSERDQVIIAIERTFQFIENTLGNFRGLMEGLDNLWTQPFTKSLNAEQLAFCRGYQAARMDALYKYALVSLIEGDLGPAPMTSVWVWRKDRSVQFG